jgi:hypothetical protein
MSRTLPGISDPDSSNQRIPSPNTLLRSYRSYTAPQRAPHKPQHRSSVPDVPPKPPPYPVHLPLAPRYSQQAAVPTAPSLTAHDSAEVGEALNLSRTTATKEQENINHEEEELAKALEESVLLGETSVHEFLASSAASIQTRPLPLTLAGVVGVGVEESSVPRSTSPEVITSPSTLSSQLETIVTLEASSDLLTQLETDAALARQLAAEEEATRGDHPDAEDDAAFARRLAQEQEAEFDQSMPKSLSDNAHLSSGLPSYDDVARATPPSIDAAGASPVSPNPLLSRNTSHSSSNTTSSIESGGKNTRSPSDLSSPQVPASSLTSVSESDENFSNSSRPIGNAMSPNQFVDAELLAGVSLNFTAPIISPRLAPFQGPMPNIISLPYGRCPPLHVQAPNWRHLLKLLIRLSATRIEPTVEAMAVNKDVLQLRTVIQFVRTHHQSSDWKTVLWLTIDHPVPASLPGAFKFTNGDVNVLPFSYTLSNVPALLRDGAESHMSKAYTVPSTPNIPFPTLPLSFPNLAMYLQAVLDESRRCMNDSSSGIRKLAKMMDTCYPQSPQEGSLYPPEAPNGVGGLLKRVIGRGRNNKKTRGTNEDTFEFITPFVPDEWG